MSELKVPSLGMDMSEATIVRWLVSEGDEVKKGEPILEIDTDKTSFEVEAPEDGVIRNLRGAEGETLPVGSLLAHVASSGKDAPEPSGEEPSGEEPGGEGPGGGDSSATNASSGEDAGFGKATDNPVNGGERKVRASPAARRAAVERGVRIEDIPGSGPGGRVYLSDVVETPGAPGAWGWEPPAAVPSPVPSSGNGVVREKLSRARRIGAERTARSFSEVPHFHLTREIEAGRMMELRDRLEGRMEPVPSVNDIFAFAVARALEDHPRINGRYEDGELVVNPGVNLGIAVATDDGLVVPVLEGADALRLREFTARAKNLVRRAREKRLSARELSGGTFTVSNLGMMGIDSFDPIINAPEAAILGIGRVRVSPEWRGGKWVPREVVSVTLAVDHRSADGADGARFLADLQGLLLDWETLL